jgi:hypothetical protein
MPGVPTIAALRFAPLLPPALLAALAIACVLVLGLALWRRARGTGWRALAFALLLLWLAGPRLTEETRQGLPDIGLLVIDHTASMSLRDRQHQADAAARLLAERAGRLPDLILRTVTVPESGHDGTRLFAAIDQALADIPRQRLAGIVALTDGQVDDRPAAPLPAPLHVLIPAAGEETDRRVRLVEAPTYGIVGRDVTLRFVVEDLGPGSEENRTAQVTLRRDGEPPQVESVPVGSVQSVTLPVTHPGPSVVDIAADPLPGEVSPLNNRVVAQINGVRDRLRVLLVSGEPNQGERTWRRLLKSDPAVDLVHFTILRPPEKDDMTPLNELALIAFPVRELFQEKIRQFDLIILDRFQNRGILPTAYLRNIADYVRAGGGLLLSVGPEFAGPTSLDGTPLTEVLPAHMPVAGGELDETFRPRVTALGERHPVTAGLPGANAGNPTWGPWYRALAPEQVAGQVVMTGAESQPLLVLNHAGEGRVAMLLSDQIWLWSRGHLGGGPQAELLRRAAHWLMKEPELDEEALTARIEGGRLLVERRSLAETPHDSVTVTAPDGHTTPLTLAPTAPGRATGQQDATLPGVWQVSDGTRTAFAAAEAANAAEFADLRATASRLGDLAKASGGSVRFLGADGVPDVRRTDPDDTAAGAGWIGLRRNGAHLVTGAKATALLPPWLALPLLFGAVLLAWRREAA